MWTCGMTYWRLKGRELANCNCEYGCNCQFGGLPDKGHCQAVFGMAIDEGSHGDVDLSGLNIAAVFRWPGPIHEGKGECAAFVDERASAEQRDALLTIMTGGDTDPFAPVFAVFASTIRSEEHTSELQSLMRISYAVFCLKKKKKAINRYE